MCKDALSKRVGYVAPHQEHRAEQVRALEEKAKRLAEEVAVLAAELAERREWVWTDDPVDAPDKKTRKRLQKALQRTARLACEVPKGIAAHDRDLSHLLVVIQSYDATWNTLPPGWRLLVGRKMVSEYNARKGSVEAPDE